MRGSGAPEKAARWEAHIVHFEVHHSAGARRRDAERIKRAERDGARNIDVNLREIDVLRRDNYTCQMCNFPIILNERPRHPKGPSIDHIEWLSHGGDHTMDNVQAAHLQCNVREGYALVKAKDGRAQRSRTARARYRRRQVETRNETLRLVAAWAAVILVIVVLLAWMASL